MVAATVRPIAAVLATVVIFVAAVALNWFEGQGTQIGAGAAVVISVAIGLAVVQRALKAFGGITGDVLGAGVELGLASALLTLALTA
jgi:adenosylcobinamide-GDP ribazoletransferase